MQGHNKLLGNYGEQLAVDFLEAASYKILERNFSCRLGEIDIIAVKEDTIIFTEVKTRTGETYGTPSQAVNNNKQTKLVKTALFYLNNKNLFDYMSRFDVIEIIMEKDVYKINHIIDAFQYSGKYGY